MNKIDSKVLQGPDRIIILFGLFLIFLGLIIFIFPPLSFGPLRDTNPIGKILEMEFESKRKFPGALNWSDTEEHSPLFQGDQILTDDRSTVTVSLKDGSSIHIGQQSLVKIELKKDSYEVFLIKGELELKGNPKLKVIDSQTGEQINLTGKTKFTSSLVNLNPEDNFLGPISDGCCINPSKVSDITLQHRQIETGEIEIRNADGTIFQQKKLSGASDLAVPVPSPGRYTVTMRDKEKKIVGFQSFKVLPFTTPEIKIMKSPVSLIQGAALEIEWNGRKDLQYELAITSTEKTKTVPVKDTKFHFVPSHSGKYEFQVTLFDGKIGYKGKKVITEVELNPGILIPESQTNLTAGVGEQLTYNVQTFIGKGSLQLEAALDENFEVQASAASFKQTALKVTFARPGEYYVRARSEGELSYVSNISKVLVSAPVAKAAKIYRPQTVMALNGAKTLLSWTAKYPINEIRLLVSNDPSFQNLLVDEVTAEHQKELELPLGQYFWKLVPSDDTPKYFHPSEVYAHDVVLPKLQRPSIIQKQIIEFIEGAVNPSYKIKLPSDNMAKQYTIEIFADQNLQKLVFAHTSEAPIITWTTERVGGVYYYRMKITDHWDRPGPYSDTGELIFPISPMVEL